MIYRLTLFFLLPFLLVACQKDDDTLPESGNVRMEVGETLRSSGGLLLTFRGITEDNRCPLWVMCISPGRSVAEFLVEKSDERHTLLLTDNENPNFPEPESAEFFGRKITLLEVTPYPEAGQEIDPADYQVQLRIE